MRVVPADHVQPGTPRNVIPGAASSATPPVVGL
jgi:hypothetical protein